MKVITFLSFLSLLILSCGERSGHKAVDADHEAEKKLQVLLDRHEYFDLKSILTTYRDRISPDKFQFYSAVIQNAFNQNALSVETINNLMGIKHSLQDSLLAKLMLIQRDNYIKMFDYKNAATSGRQILEKYKDHFDDKKIKDLSNKNTIYEGLTNTPPQNTIVKQDALINWKRDKVGLMTVPVTTGTFVHDFIFDTRAGISVISKSYAEKFKLRMPGVRYMEGSGITGKTFQAELGIADSLMIGNIKVFNVVFQVLPDEILSFPSMDYFMKGIIGFPVIRQLKKIRINQNGTMTLNSDADPGSVQNIAFDESAIVVHARGNEDTLSFYLDSGANHSELFSNYFTKKKAVLKQIARIDTIEVGGVGGMVKKEVYTLPTFTVSVGDQKAELKDIQVLTNPTYPGQKYYGNLGQDLLAQFSEIAIDFDSMTLSFK